VGHHSGMLLAALLADVPLLFADIAPEADDEGFAPALAVAIVAVVIVLVVVGVVRRSKRGG